MNIEWKSGPALPYKCSACGGSFTAGHYCIGKLDPEVKLKG